MKEKKQISVPRTTLPVDTTLNLSKNSKYRMGYNYTLKFPSFQVTDCITG